MNGMEEMAAEPTGREVTGRVVTAHAGMHLRLGSTLATHTQRAGNRRSQAAYRQLSGMRNLMQSLHKRPPHLRGELHRSPSAGLEIVLWNAGSIQPFRAALRRARKTGSNAGSAISASRTWPVQSAPVCRSGAARPSPRRLARQRFVQHPSARLRRAPHRHVRHARRACAGLNGLQLARLKRGRLLRVLRKCVRLQRASPSERRKQLRRQGCRDRSRQHLRQPARRRGRRQSATPDRQPCARWAGMRTEPIKPKT